MQTSIRFGRWHAEAQRLTCQRHNRTLTLEVTYEGRKDFTKLDARSEQRCNQMRPLRLFFERTRAALPRRLRR